MRVLVSLSLILFFTPFVVFADPPSANPDSRAVPKNTPVTIDVLANDVDVDGDSIFLDADSVSQPVNGSITVNEDGGIRYVPNSGFVGSDEFTYEIVTYRSVTDAAPIEERARGVVTITVVDTQVTANTAQINDRGIAQSIDSVCRYLGTIDSATLTGGYGELATNCENLLSLFASNPEAAREAIQQIAPEETLALLKIGRNASALQSNIVSKRMTQLASNSTYMSDQALSWSSRPLGGAAGDIPWSKLGFFATVQLETAEKDRTAYESGFDHRSYGITFGGDYALSSNWHAGSALGWTKNAMDYKSNGGSVNSDAYTLLAFTTYHIENFSVDAQVGIGNSSIDVSRRIAYGLPGAQFLATTAGKTNGDQWLMKLQGQYMWNHNALSLYPLFRYNLSHSSVGRYAENDAGGWEVVIGEQNTRQQTIELGLQGTYAINKSWGVIIPSFDFNVIADIDTDHDVLYSNFAFAPEETAGFAMYGEPPESVFYMAGLGCSAVLPNGGSMFMNMTKTLSYADYSALQFQFGFRLEY